MGSVVTAIGCPADYLLGLRQDTNDFGVKVCYSVHVASVGTVIPAQLDSGLANEKF